MHWNHRVVRTVDDETLEVTLRIAEVYYNSDTDKPFSYSEPFLVGETLEELTETVDRMKAALAQPVLAYPADFDLSDKAPWDEDEDDTPVAPV